MVAGEGFAQTRWLHLDPLFWEASAEFDGTWRDNDLGSSSQRQTDLGLRVKATGYSVDPRVLRNCDIDPQVYSGFAFGLGVDRVAMIRHGIPNIRWLFDNDERLLRQVR